MNKLCAIVGMCGAGKSKVCDAFVAAGFARVYFGGATMDELARLGLERNEENERRVRENLRASLGPAAFAIKALPKIEAALENHPVVIDGLYSWSEYLVLREHFAQIQIVAVVTDRALRYARLHGRDVRPLTPEQAQSRDIAEIENSEKGGPIAFADHYISNNGTQEELAAKTDALIKTL